MKKISLIIIALTLWVSCNTSSKKTPASEQQGTDVATIETVKKEMSPLDYELFFGAAFDNEEAIVKEKIAAGINVNYIDKNKSTALMLAAYNGHTSIVKMLIDAGANVKTKNANNRTALMLASSGPFVETVKLLLQSGAEVNAMDSHENWTPLMFAAGEGQLEVAKVLLQAGADISMLDIDGESSYDFAISREHQEMAAFLQQLAQKKK